MFFAMVTEIFSRGKQMFCLRLVKELAATAKKFGETLPSRGHCFVNDDSFRQVFCQG
jgi:hypothetical protein